jgi:hypothetical protein
MPAGLCSEAISPGVGTTLTGSPLEIASGLAKAKELGLIIGRNRSMIAQVRTCSGITTVRFWVMTRIIRGKKRGHDAPQNENPHDSYPCKYPQNGYLN